MWQYIRHTFRCKIVIKESISLSLIKISFNYELGDMFEISQEAYEELRKELRMKDYDLRH